MAGSGGNSGDFGRWNRDGIDTRGAGIFKADGILRDWAWNPSQLFA